MGRVLIIHLCVPSAQNGNCHLVVLYKCLTAILSGKRGPHEERKRWEGIENMLFEVMLRAEL